MFSEVSIIGGGVIGLSIAVEAARAGLEVHLFDSGPIGKGTSIAAAGMLAPLKEAKKMDAFFHLGMESLRRYPDFVRALESLTGVDIEFRQRGILIVTLTKEEAALYREHLTRVPGVQWLSSDELTDRIPQLTPDSHGGVFLPTESQVNTPRLMTALVQAARKLGVVIHEYEPVLALEHEHDAVRALETPRQTYPVERVVLAAGTGVQAIRGWSAQNPVRIAPVRGQIVVLQANHFTLPHIIHGNGIYIVPRDDGSLLIGASSIENVRRLEPTAGETHELLHKAIEIIPDIATCTITDHLVGLRPATPDRWPVLGPGDFKGLDLALGHYRNGILLAPITASLFIEYWKTDAIPEMMKPFTLDRQNLNKTPDHPME